MKGKAWEYISGEAKDLVHRMLEPDADRRITIDEALQHPWIRVRGNVLLLLFPAVVSRCHG